MKLRDRPDLNGLSPCAIAFQHKVVAFQWIAQHVFSSSAILQMLLRQAASGWPARAERRGWLQSMVPVAGWPTRIYGLALPAAEFLASVATEQLPPVELDLSRINQALIRHHLIAQQMSLRALQSGLAVRIESERQISTFDRLGQKRPDAIWHLADGRRLGVEIELSGKWSRHLDHFVASLVDAMSPISGGPPRLDRFQIFAASAALIDRYRTAMAPGTPLPIWGKSERAGWRIVERRHVPVWLADRVDFRLLEV